MACFEQKSRAIACNTNLAIELQYYETKLSFRSALEGGQPFYLISNGLELFLEVLMPQLKQMKVVNLP